MKKLLLGMLVLVGCSKEELPTKKEQTTAPTCYQIVTWTDDPNGDSITIRLAPYQFQTIKVNNFRDYMGKTEVCDLTKIK